MADSKNHKGYLLREGTGALMNVKKRWFVLSSEHSSLFFAQKEGHQRALGMIPLGTGLERDSVGCGVDALLNVYSL
jgi:hypothetical protein